MHEGENKCQVLEQLPAGTRFINFLVKCNGILITRKIEINQQLKFMLNFIFTFAAVDCGTPPSPVNGAVAFQGTTLGNKAVHSCNQGYILAGAKVRVCQANGQWSDEVAQCNR